MKQKLIERLTRYVTINTRSNPYSETIPSSDNQFDLAKILVEECKEIGMSNVSMDKFGIVTATLPSNIDRKVPTIGFIAHMDTADFNSVDVKPRIIEAYDGKDIVLNEALNIVTDVATFPNLIPYKGDTLMVTDGTTLLGGDNKSGIANIMSAMEYLIENKDIEHGDIRVAFTIDEEIGTGASSFDVEGFNADFAYTVDGAGPGEMEYETFNAAAALVEFKGISVHPGSAKDALVNANLLVMEFIQSLPEDQRPEHTEDYEGFFLVTDMKGTLENASIEMIIRDHDKELFNAKKDLLTSIQEAMNSKYGYECVTLKVEDSYYNMKEILKEHMDVVDLAKDAITSVGLTPIISPVRGGTDGSRLSFMGLPTPNIFTGADNFHGKHEFASIDAMALSVKTIVAIANLNTK